jgi:hypothetical protein
MTKEERIKAKIEEFIANHAKKQRRGKGQKGSVSKSDATEGLTDNQQKGDSPHDRHYYGY